MQLFNLLVLLVSFLLLYGLKVFEYVIHLSSLNHVLEVHLKVLSEFLGYQFHILHLFEFELILSQVVIPTSNNSKGLHLLLAVLKRPWLLKLLLQWGRKVLWIILQRVLILIVCLSCGYLMVGIYSRSDLGWDFMRFGPVL